MDFVSVSVSALYDTIRDAILTCARKPTYVSLIYRTLCRPTKASNFLAVSWGLVVSCRSQMTSKAAIVDIRLRPRSRTAAPVESLSAYALLASPIPGFYTCKYDAIHTPGFIT